VLLDAFFFVVLVAVLLAYPAPDDVLFRVAVRFAVDFATDAASLMTSGAAAWIASSTRLREPPPARPACRAEGPARSAACVVSGRGAVVVALEIIRGSFRGAGAPWPPDAGSTKPAACQLHVQ
jgi:hypothetical protein